MSGHSKPLAGGIDGKAVAKGFVPKDDYKRKKELDEARKAGTEPAEVDAVTGRDINPHIPGYISKTPWYYKQEGATLEHQRNLNEQKRLDDVRASYNKGFVGRATKYRDGACENCGSMTHAKRDCFYRPRKKGAAATNEDIMPDEVIPQQMALDYDGKRDRWAGYDVGQYVQVVEEYEKLDELRRKNKAHEVMQELIAKGSKAEDAAATAEKEVADKMDTGFVEGGEEEMVGQHFDAKSRMSVRNLRIREDTAKYLYNLDPNSAFYDPKSRSMRLDPLPNVPIEDKPFAGDNFVRSGGEMERFNQMRQYAWQSQERGGDMDEVGAPSLAVKKFEEFQQQKKLAETNKTRAIMEQYGGQEHLVNAPPKELLMAQSEVYRVYAPDGSLLKGPQAAVPRSRFEEDVLIGNHKAVWGSYWAEFKWGFACCHQFVKNSVCTGEAGKRLASSAPLAAIQKPFAALAQEKAEREKDNVNATDGDKSKKKSKKKESKGEKKKKKKKEKKEDKKKRMATGEVTVADLEDYKKKRRYNDDPMNRF